MRLPVSISWGILGRAVFSESMFAESACSDLANAKVPGLLDV